MGVDGGADRRVFVSYRRDDNPFVVGHLVDRLERELGGHRLFRDLDSIPYGLDYRTHIRNALDECAAALVIIGSDWEGRLDDGGRRIDDPADLVRIEVETALGRGIPVIPVLVDELESLDHLELPGGLDELRFRNATRLRRDPDFDRDCERIAAALQPHLGAGLLAPPSVGEQLEALRRRLVTADRPELERLGYEARALRAAHPHDPDVQQFADQVERALAPPPPAAARPAGMPVPSRTFGPWFRIAAVSVLIVGGLGLVATVVLQSGGGSQSPPPTDPTVEPPPTTVERSACDQLTVSVTGFEDLELLGGTRRVRVALTITNGGDDVSLPGSTSASFVDSTGAQVPVELPTGPDSGWFQPVDLAGGTRFETSVVTDAAWRDRGAELERIRIPDIHPVGQPFDTCSFDGAL